MGILTFEDAKFFAEGVNIVLDISESAHGGVKCVPHTIEDATGTTRYIPRIEGVKTSDQLDAIAEAVGKCGLGSVLDGIDVMVGEDRRIMPLFTILPQGSLVSSLAQGDQ